MYVHTTKAASLLGISPRRLRQLLQQGRVKGAYKSGKFWLIPLYNGLPQITKAKRGQAGTWKTKKQPKKTIVHVNSNTIKRNAKKSFGQREPVIAIKGRKNINVHQLEIPVPCRVIYQPDKPLSCGAKVWIEVLDFDLESIQPLANIVHKK
ncbi:MAG: helix-turn-helix domain-containing protein [Xenococcaceae cyanobacterium MO_167.B27]|nr:helix-turn-helix domain-containing protein [Xenococcaceae cyanobacterium MO_167.B27]